jgi:hypothetical protein
MKKEIIRMLLILLLIPFMLTTFAIGFVYQALLIGFCAGKEIMIEFSESKQEIK